MITILDLALFRGAKEVNGSISAKEVNRVGLPFVGGCMHCQATIAAYNAYPSKAGYLKCSDCIGDDGWETVEQADKDLQ